MPQKERFENIKKMLEWLGNQKDGATTGQLHSYTKWEICEGGATDNTIRTYIEDCKKQCLIEYKHPRWFLTEAGRIWLEKHAF